MLSLNKKKNNGESKKALCERDQERVHLTANKIDECKENIFEESNFVAF